MFAAVLSLSLLGVALGLALGYASKVFAVENDPVVDDIIALMPGSNCGQCGFPGCPGAAAAIADGSAPPTVCPPGGKALVAAIAERLGITVDLSAVADAGPQIAVVAEELCIGCCRCARACPTDAILGAAKQIHNVLNEACTGCNSCVDKCPTEAIAMQPVPVTLQHWVWPRPAAPAAVTASA